MFLLWLTLESEADRDNDSTSSDTEDRRGLEPPVVPFVLGEERNVYLFFFSFKSRTWSTECWLARTVLHPSPRPPPLGTSGTS